MGKPKPIGPRDEMGGREVQAKPMEWYERANPRASGEAPQVGAWPAPPKPPPGVSAGRGMKEGDLDKLRKENPDFYSKDDIYGNVEEHRKGGMVKGGSFTTPRMCGGGKVIKSYGR